MSKQRRLKEWGPTMVPAFWFVFAGIAVSGLAPAQQMRPTTADVRQGLNSDNVEVRRSAAACLNLLDASSDGSVFALALSNQDAQVRLSALRSLHLSPEFGDALFVDVRRLLGDDNRDVRLAAIGVLPERLMGEQARQTIRVLLTTASEADRVAVISQLRPTRIFDDTLMTQLASTDSQLLLGAIARYLLRNHTGEDAEDRERRIITSLLQRLEDPIKNFAMAPVIADALRSSSFKLEWLSSLITNEDVDKRALGMYLVSELNDWQFTLPRHSALRDALTARLADPDPRIVERAISAIANFGEDVTDVLPQLTALLDDGAMQDPLSHWIIAESLLRIDPDNEEALHIARKVFAPENRNTLLKRRAVGFLSRLRPQPPRLAAFLQDIAASGAGQNRYLALEALAVLSDTESCDSRALVELTNDQDPEVRQLAFKALMPIADKLDGFREVILRMARDSEASNRQLAVTQLAMDGDDLTDSLILLIDDRDSEVRLAAIDALTWARPSASAVDRLVRIVMDGDEPDGVRYRALKAIVRLSPDNRLLRTLWRDGRYHDVLLTASNATHSFPAAIHDEIRNEINRRSVSRETRDFVAGLQARPENDWLRNWMVSLLRSREPSDRAAAFRFFANSVGGAAQKGGQVFEPISTTVPEYFVARWLRYQHGTAQKGSAGPTGFPWPPPRWTTRGRIPNDTLGTEADPLRQIHARLVQAIELSCLHTPHTLAAPDGFALLTRFEQIHETGEPVEGDSRFSDDWLGLAELGLWGMLRQAFRRRAGHYRVFLFAVTTEPLRPPTTVSDRQGLGDELTFGFTSPEVADLLDDAESRFDGYDVHVFVYHFVKQEGVNTNVEFLVDNNQSLPAYVHLQRSGILRALNR